MLAGAMPFVARLGVEPSELAMMIYGGAGAIHGPLLAQEMGITRVVVPRLSAVFCAFGCLVSDLLHDGVRSVHGQHLEAVDFLSTFAELRREGADWLTQQATGLEPAYEYRAEMRYAGQSFEVDTLLDPDAAVRGDLASVAQSFHNEHARLFGHSRPDAPTETIALRLRTRGVLPSPAASPPVASATDLVSTRSRCALFAGTWHDTTVHAWTALPPGWNTAGPAIIEQETATVVVPPDFTVRLGTLGDLILEAKS
jgi:N-methylhydantoinase A